MGMGMNAAGNMMGAVAQPTDGGTNPFINTNQAAQPAEDGTAKLLEMKKLLDAGAITQEDYDKVKAQILGI